MHTHATPEKTNSSSFVNKKKQPPFFAPVTIQPKLTIGGADDHYEREANATADKVMRMTGHDIVSPKPAPIEIQRKCKACEEEEKLQRKEKEDDGILMMKPVMDIPLQRKCAHCEEEEKHVQKKETAPSSPEVSSSIHEVLQSSGHSLDHATQTFMESRFGYDFSRVQIHNDSLAHRSSSDINAYAYTHGSHIVFGAGQYQPHTQGGKHLLAHELTHVVQQGSANSLSNIVNRKEGDDEKRPLTRYEEIEQSIDTPGEFEVTAQPFGISLYNFAINRFYLKNEHKAALKKLSTMLKSSKSNALTLYIVGNTDSTGTPAINDPLSVNRAASVRNLLKDLTGKKYPMQGEGENNPVVANETDTGRSRNRRVDIEIRSSHHDDPHPVPKPNPDMPPAYSHFYKPKIERDVLWESETTDDCPHFWSCIDIHIPWIPFWIPKCARLAVECFGAEDPEACYEFYKECTGNDDDKKKRACVEQVELPDGNLAVDAMWPYMALRDPFWMKVDFIQDPEKGCYCECGEFELKIRGYFEKEFKDGRVEREEKHLSPTTDLHETIFQEDGSGAANSAYGHRSGPGQFINSGSYFFVNKFFDTQSDGCSYRGLDKPRFGNDIADSENEVRRTWLLEFHGYPVDSCLAPGIRIEIPGWGNYWKVQGEIKAPPPEPTGSKTTKPGGKGPGGGVQHKQVNPTKAKTHPTQTYLAWYGGGIHKNAQAGQTYDMTLLFRLRNGNDVYSYTVPVKIIEPTNADFVTIETLNNDDLNLAPPGEDEIVLGKHNVSAKRRSEL
jgi:outer membrane protein OmpA-like peptidoglycan-associated protein